MTVASDLWPVCLIMARMDAPPFAAAVTKPGPERMAGEPAGILSARKRTLHDHRDGAI